MGANGSEPQEELQIGNERNRDSVSEIHSNPTIIHEKYEEITYNEIKVLEKPFMSIPPAEIFNIAVCHPEFCQSVTDMIRHAIRIESIQEKKTQPNYRNDFSFVDNMEYNRVKVYDRFQLQYELRLFFNESKSISKKIYSATKAGNDPDINFQGILSYFRNSWYINNQNTIETLQKSIQSLLGQTNSNSNSIDEQKLRQVIAQIIGKEEYDCLVPKRSFNAKEILIELRNLKRRIFMPISVCSMLFPSTTKYINKIDIKGKILRHGICSNGTFLFILTEEKTLFVYRIYKGMIDKIMNQINMRRSWKFNEETYLFCSQKLLFLKNEDMTYQADILNLTKYNLLYFSKSDRPEFEHLIRACSNGVSYSIINDSKAIQIFNAETEMFINRYLTKFVLDKSTILLSNGYFFGLLTNSGKIRMFPLNASESVLFEQEDNFPIENDANVEAATIDILTNSYFSVSYSESKSIVYCYPYTGATDLTLFGSNIQNDKTVGSFLLNHISSCAFSSAIPDIFLTQSQNVCDDLKSIMVLIDKNTDDIDLCKALLFLLEINLRKLDCKDFAIVFLPFLIRYLKSDKLKRISAAVIINNIDLFFVQVENFHQVENLFDLLKSILSSSFDNDCQMYNEWLLTCLLRSSLLNQIDINKDLLTLLFGEDWLFKSRMDKNYSWMVDFLLISQQTMSQNGMKYLEKDHLNVGNSKLINSLCDQANFLFENFNSYLKKIINDHPDIYNRNINYDTILYTLISNFVAIVSPITQCSQFAMTITNENAKSIIELLSNEFIYKKQLQPFVEYFDMIYTLSISSLIRGGPVYQCEIDYSWLIQGNFYNGSRKMTASDLSESLNFLSSIEDNEFMSDFIKNDNENINYLYQKIRSFRPVRNNHAIIDRIILAAVFHQTNMFDLFYGIKEQNVICPEITSIVNFAKKIRINYSKALQKEVASNNSKEIKQTDKYIANMGILIILDPVLVDFQEKTPAERTKYFQLLEQFILNNDPHQFNQVLQAVPSRINSIITSLERLNSLFYDVQNPTLKKIIIDGISRVDSFERLGYLLSNAKLDKNDLSVLEIFCLTCTDMVVNFKQLSILEILYTVFETCKTLNEKAIKTMNEISKIICKKTFVLDSYFMTVAGLAGSACIMPENFDKLPEIGKAYILQLIYAKKDITTQSITEILNFVIKSKTNYEQYILNEVWVKMIFTLLSNCQYNKIEMVFDCLEMIFQMTSNLIDDRCLVFSSLPAIIYGFRHLLNLHNDVSEVLYNLMTTITTESKIGEIFLLFSIIGANFSDFSNFYEIRNQKGRWLKCPNNYCLPLPLLPFCERHDFNINEINESIQEEELNLNLSLGFDWIIEYWDICMKNHGSLLCRIYLESLSRYVSDLDVKFPEKCFAFLANTAKPYVDFYQLSSKQTMMYKIIAKSFKDIKPILPETRYGFGQIKQFESTHLFIYNAMKHGQLTIYSYIRGKGYLIIHNHDMIVINIQSGMINNSTDRIDIDDGQLFINVQDNDLVISVNNKCFQCEENSYLEFIIDSIDHSIFDLDKRIDFNSPRICYSDNVNNMDIDYINDIFAADGNTMNDFADDLNGVVPVNAKNANANVVEREGMNICYNQIADTLIFKKRKKFIASPSIFCHFCRSNELMICNQLKSVILAHAVIKNPDSLDWKTIFSLVKSAVITLGGFDMEKLFKGQFPFQLENGFFHNFSLNFLQSRNAQTFFIAMKTLLKSKSFMDNLGKQLVLMAQDHIYHSLIHKKELVFFVDDQFLLYKKNENDYFIDFPDGTKGKLEIDEFGNWMVNTPMVLLILLWIFIDNCSSSEQRINAKLALIDCWIIKSPLIYKFLPEFLSFMQKKLLFSPEDFNPIYIHHLSSLAHQNRDNEQIMNFYEFERNCHKLIQIQQQISLKSINLNTLQKFDFDLYKKSMNPRKLIEVIQLMKTYTSVDQFPAWYFLPIWRTISSFSLKKYSDFNLNIQQRKPSVLINLIDEPLLFTITGDETLFVFEIFDTIELKNGQKLIPENQSKSFMTHFVIQPHQRKFLVMNNRGDKLIKIQTYQVFKNEQITYENFESDIKNFAVNWSDKETDELLSFDFYTRNFLWLILDTLNLTQLINSFGIRTVQCKVACLFLINSINDPFSLKSSQAQLSLNENEMIRLCKENSKLLSYQIRKNEFEFQITPSKPGLLSLGLEYLNNKQMGYIIVNSDSATKFLSGEIENVNDSMIYQISKHIKADNIKRFQNSTWAIKFKGKEAVDFSGVTHQTISMSVQSFLSPKTGICIIAPNFTEIGSNETDVQVIPYPSKNNKNVFDVLYSFGVILGSIIRTGTTQEISFPFFVWNFLSGKTITKSDIYENDTRLKDEIIGLKDGTITDHLWVYRDWNNVIKPINGCPSDKFVHQDLAEVYETLVIDLRIESIEKYLAEIRKGFWNNQNIQNPRFLSGNLVMFLCHGKKSFDNIEIIKRINFNNGNDQLKNNFLSILKEYDEKMMESFLLFVTASKKPPNFVISPEFNISVEFLRESDKLPTAQTCFKLIQIPSYQTIDMMRNRLNYAILNCLELEIS